MVSALLSRLVILVFGTLYPAYASYKAVKTKNVKEYVKWMMYWIVFALFITAETFADILLSWVPFYYEMKIVFVFWLLSPVTKGSSFLYKKFVHPQLNKREKEIDEYIAQARTKGYSTLLTLGHRGVSYATNIVVNTAIKGQSTLVEHIKKSYSTNDLRVHENSVDEADGPHIVDSDEEFDNRLLEDNRELENRESDRRHERRPLHRSKSDASDTRTHRKVVRSSSGLKSVPEDGDDETETVTESVTEEIIYYSPRKGGHYTQKEVKMDPYATLPRTRSRGRPKLNQ